MYSKKKKKEETGNVLCVAKQFILMLVKTSFLLPTTITVLRKPENIYLLFNKLPCFLFSTDLILLYNSIPGPLLLIYAGLEQEIMKSRSWWKI